MDYLDYVKHSGLRDDGSYSGQDMSSDELYHYGILGMRWGHRKNPERMGFIKKHKLKKKIAKNKDRIAQLNKQSEDLWKKYDKALERELMNPKSKFSKWFENRNADIMNEYGKTWKDFRSEAKKDFDKAFVSYFHDWGDQDWDNYVRDNGKNDKSITDAIDLDNQMRQVYEEKKKLTSLD